ncbi:zinc finger protein 595-like [Culicoides brevitarsis]|uniref:zinc finger protein 595-like n=1 Tax=Culicoides brevitarsis TaxID=469753 RepID=UPI00307C4AA7
MGGNTDKTMENMSEAELLNQLKNSCRLCLSESQSRVHLLTKERHGMTLMEMANSLTGLQINEFEGAKSLNVCLNCAGKVVSLHEFREVCQVSDKKLNDMEVALRLKRMKKGHASNTELNLDDDMQIFYVCKVCKLSFNDSQLEEFKAHKAQHITNGEIPSQSTPIKQEDGHKKSSRKRKSMIEASTSLVSALYDCGSCSMHFPTFMSRQKHLAEFHANDVKTTLEKVSNGVVDKNETFPTSKKRSRRARGNRSPVVAKHSSTPKVGGKAYICESCDQTFPNHKGLYWHRLKTHGLFRKFKSSNKVAATKATPPPPHLSPKEVKTEQYECRYCDKVFDKRYSKYNHERVCAKNVREDESEEVIEQPAPVEPVVELNEDETFADGGVLKCSRCPDEFSSGRARSLHEKNVHNLQINECRVCGKVLSGYASRYQHEKRCAAKDSSAAFDQSHGNDADDEESDVLNGALTSGFQAAFAQSL